MAQLAAQRDFGRHRVFDSCLARLLVFNELIMVVHQLLYVTRVHEIVQGSLEASHVRPVKVLGGETDSLWSNALLLNVAHSRIVKHALSLTNSSKQVVALFVYHTGLSQAPVLCDRLGVGDVVKFDEVFRQCKSMVEYEPHALLGVIFFRPVNTLDSLVLFNVHRGVFPNI